MVLECDKEGVDPSEGSLSKLSKLPGAPPLPLTWLPPRVRRGSRVDETPPGGQGGLLLNDVGGTPHEPRQRVVPDIGIIGILFFGSLEAFHQHWALRATHTAVPRDIQRGIRSR